MKREKVKSSTIESIGYDEKTKTLEVEFKPSGIYQYFDVEKQTYDNLIKAESVGSYHAKIIRGKFQYKKLSKNEERRGEKMEIIDCRYIDKTLRCAHLRREVLCLKDNKCLLTFRVAKTFCELQMEIPKDIIPIAFSILETEGDFI